MKKIFGVLAFLHAVHAQALDGVSLELGRGGHDVSLARLGAQWDWRNGWGYWELSGGVWGGGRGTLYDLGFTPVFRRGDRLYAEGAIGVHWLSSTTVEPGRDVSTHFQFGDHLAVGWRTEKLDLSLRLQHLSNGGIRNPNPGINFLQLRLQVPLR